jgi:peptidoglycan DL-endopeptidase RipA
MEHPRRVAARAAVLLALVVLAGAVFPGVSLADPSVPPSGSAAAQPGPSGRPAPPAPVPLVPANPSDQALRQSRQGVASAAARVGQLSAALAEAQAKVDELGDQLEARRELANKALVDLRRAQEAAAAASARVRVTGADAEAARSSVSQAQTRVDQFVALAYQQGMLNGSLGVLAQAGDPADLVGRAQLTQAVAADQLAAIDAVQRARIAMVNADSLARAARQAAQDGQRRALDAKRTADAAVASAGAAMVHGVAALRKADAERADISHQLDVLTSNDAALRGQRQRYLAYRDQQAAAQRAKAAAAAARVSAAGPTLRPSSAGAARSVIDRALSKVGVSYAWGGGDASGATQGIRDGGEADSFGDYNKVGFDCSGLMMYAFGAVGIGLPHYSGYQYDQGAKVPISQIRPGDLLFWANDGAVHHVALYIGDGQMVEAPYSGGAVRIAPVRYGRGLLPEAVRLL